MISLKVIAIIAIIAALVARWRHVATLPDLKIRGDVLLVFAHPDDEAMFFAPILHLAARRGRQIHFLCLSDGNYDGLGKIREGELYDSAAFFGVLKRNVKVVRHAELQDGMQERWPAGVIRSEVDAYLQKVGTIGTVITFDRHGISGHPNHIATHMGVRELKSKMPPGIIFLELRTRSIVPKYSSIAMVLRYCVLTAPYKDREHFAAVLPPRAIATSWRAMRRHKSQLAWFRYLYLLFSSYTFVNELRELAA